MATVLTSCSCGCRPPPFWTILWFPPAGTQSAAVNTSFGAIRAPVQELPREPTMVMTDRPTPSVDGTPPPTIAPAGAASSSTEAAISRGRLFIEDSLRPSSQPSSESIAAHFSEFLPAILIRYFYGKLACAGY